MKGLIFTYLLTVTGVVGGVFNPYIGLLVYVCLSIVQPPSMWPWAVSPESFSRLVALSMLAGWALRGFGNWRFGRAGTIVTMLLGYWMWMAGSAALAGNQKLAWSIVLFHAKIILPFLVGLTLIESPRQLKWLAWVIVLSQGYLAFELNLSFYGGYNRVWEEGFAGMDNNTVAIAMVTSVGLAFFLGLGTNRLWLQGLAFGSAALMAHVILFSYSRGGMLALALTGIMAFFLIPKKPRHYLAFALAVALALRLAGPEVRERFLTTFAESGARESSAQSRLDLWRDALDTALGRPVFGVGPDNWGLIASAYGWPEGKEAHSLWMQCAAELGFPGLLMLASFYGLCIVRLWPLTREETPVPDPWIRDAARMVIAALFGFAVSAQFVTIKMMEVQFYIALIGLGVLRLAPAEEPAPAGVRFYTLPQMAAGTTR
jgi:probable O-glycosylation ligase (exosortase A-associated)